MFFDRHYRPLDVCPYREYRDKFFWEKDRERRREQERFWKEYDPHGLIGSDRISTEASCRRLSIGVYQETVGCRSVVPTYPIDTYLTDDYSIIDDVIAPLSTYQLTQFE